MDRGAFAPDVGAELGDDAETSFARGVDAPMEPVMADFSDGAGAAAKAVGAGVGVVIGAVVTDAGVLLAS